MSSDYCSCSKSAHARGAVREPRARLIGHCLTMAAHSFLKHFFEGLFSQKSRNLKENGTQNGSQFDSFFTLFWRKANMRKTCWGSSENPSERVLRGFKNHKKLHIYEHNFYNPAFSRKNRKIRKNLPQHGSQNVT